MKELLIGVLLAGVVGCEATMVQDSGWEHATPAEVGMNPDLMQRLGEAVTAGEFTNLHGVIVVKGGRIVLESFAPGVDGDDLQYVASVTKSVGSLLLGMAMDRDRMPGLEDGVLDMGLSELFPEHAEIVRADPQKGPILLRHVLSMTAGLEWDEDSHPYDDPRNDWVRVRGADDPIGLILEQPVTAAPGSEFAYSGAMSTLVGALLDRATNGDPRAFAEKELFEPLGISDYQWWDLQGGLIDVPGGLSLRPRDMAKIGRLVLQGGVWNGEQVVSQAWVRESTRMHFTNTASPDYGLHWWGGEHYFRGQSTFVVMASGHGGQRIVVIPEFDLVVVIAQQVFDNPMADMNGLSVLGRYILPAAVGSPESDAFVSFQSEALGAAVGTYRSEQGEFSIELREGALWALAENTPDQKLDRVGPAHFRAALLGLIEVDFEFHLGADGNVEGGRTTFGFRVDEVVKVR